MAPLAVPDDEPATSSRPPLSPGALSAPAVDDETIALQVQQFLDDWHFRFVHCSLGKSWSRQRVLRAALEVFEANGMQMTPAERDGLLDLEEAALVEQLVDRMPMSLRENFEFLSLQLKTVVQTASLIRTRLEENSGDKVQEIMEQSDAGITQQVLKRAVVQASREAASLRTCQASWTKSTERRLDRLLRSTELAEKSRQQLMAVEAQLESYGANQSSKSKKVLMGIAGNQAKALCHTCFSTWVGFTMKQKAEAQIREKYEKQLRDAEAALYQYKEKQLANVKAVLMRNAQGENEMLLHWVIGVWTEDIAQSKKDKEMNDGSRAMEAKLRSLKDGQKNDAKKVMTKLAADREGGLLSFCLQAWIQFSVEYKKDKELEDQVKKTEKSLQEHMKKKKEEAKQVLDRMSAGSDSGLLALMMQYWTQYVQEVKKGMQLEDKLNEAEGRFASLKARQRAGANNVQTRVNEQIKINLLMKIMGWWVQETKVNRVEKHFNNKIDAKRKQLLSVQQLFKSFATQLEAGLGNVENDSSGRRMSRKQTSPYAEKPGRVDVGVSLPDIHARPVPTGYPG